MRFAFLILLAAPLVGIALAVRVIMPMIRPEVAPMASA